MAKDKVASSGTEASHSKKNVSKKMQEVNNKIFVPVPRSPSNFILGPCFKNTIPPELSSLYPLAEGEKLLLHSVQPDWFGGKYLNSWPSVTRRWYDWVDRVEKAKGEVWKSADIYDAIQLSKNKIPKDKNLLFAALCYWSSSTNSFHFRFGMMGPTVLDIVALTGLRPHGEEVSAVLGMGGSTHKVLNMSDGEMAETAVTEEEHISFLFTWLSEHLFCDSSLNMIEQCKKLAVALAAGRKLALAPFLLSNLYHGCTEIIMGRFLFEKGPFWILQFWLQSYFPEFQPAILDNCNFPTYGYPLAEGVLRCKSFNDYFLFFCGCSSRTANQFTPFSSRKFGPEWFKKSLDPNFQKLNKPELQDIWASYLIARDLPYSILLDESSKCKYGVEHYSPNQFARQFGMTQAVPFHQLSNKLPIRRKDFQSSDYTEETESRFCQLKRKFSFVPFDTNPSCTRFFLAWWSTYINTWDKTAIDVLWKILPHVMPFSPSVRQQVAAPRSNLNCTDSSLSMPHPSRVLQKHYTFGKSSTQPLTLLKSPSNIGSNGIKGNSQSAGKFGQNMKRKYGGESIPLQSLAQQAEPIQQKNWHEAGEKIPTRTLCKKVKTCSMKMPPPGFPSTGPSTSVFPTISTSASISGKEGEKFRVSPSLANTRSKTSDIIEPPASPVKFDNPEDFFARVSEQIKRAQSFGSSADQSSSIDDKIAMQKSKPSAEMLATANGDIERLLVMPSQDLLLPKNCSALSAALSIYAAAPDLSVERVLVLEKLKENLLHFSLTLRRAKKDQDEYFKKAAKKVPLVDELTKDQEHYTYLEDCHNKLECKMNSIKNQINKLKASLKDAKTKKEAIQEQKLSLAKKCSGKSNALDEMETELLLLKEMKELADSDVARVEESLRDFKSKIIE